MNRTQRIAAAIAVPVTLAGIAFGSVYASGGFSRVTADFRGGTAATEQIKASGAYRIAAYDAFFDKCAAIQGKEAQIAALRAESERAAGSRAEIVAINISALTGSRGAAIARYNADAAKAGTEGQFRDSSLPYRINPDQETTTCAL